MYALYVVMRIQSNFQLLKSHISNTCSVVITRQGSHFVRGIKHGCVKISIDLNRWIQRYTSILWHRMVGLDQNVFLNLLEYYSLETLSMELLSNLYWKIFLLQIYIYLELFILRINIIIEEKSFKASKKTYRKNVLWSRKILLQAKGKKIKKFKSCSWCCIKDWQQFDILLVVRKWI